MLTDIEKDAEIVNESMKKTLKLSEDLAGQRLLVHSDPNEYLASKAVKIEDLLRQISEEVRDMKKRMLSAKHGIAAEMTLYKIQHRLKDFDEVKEDEKDGEQ